MPLVSSNCPALVAGTALDTLRPDIQLVVSMQNSTLLYAHRRRKVMAFTGQTLFRALAAAKPGSRYRMLFEPCEKVSLFLEPLHPETELARLLERFQQTRLGFALVAEGDKFGVVRLQDMISLYRKGVIATEAALSEIASRGPAQAPEHNDPCRGHREDAAEEDKACLHRRGT